MYPSQGPENLIGGTQTSGVDFAVQDTVDVEGLAGRMNNEEKRQ